MEDNNTFDEVSDEVSDETKETIPDEGGDEADVTKSEIKDELGKALGKEFPDNETALKAVKDTFSYVGKLKDLKNLDNTMSELREVLGTDQKGVIQKIKEMKPTGDFVLREEFDKSNFYNQNEEYKPYIKLVETYKRANPDKSRDEVIQSDDFKSAFSKIKSHDEIEQSKSVLKSSPRLGAATDKISQAKELSNKGNLDEAERLATDAVLDAYEK